MLADWQNGELRLRVLHVELELVRRVSRVQRRGNRPRPCHRKEHDHELQPVRQRDGHRPPGLHSRARQQFGDALNLRTELRVAHIRTARNAYRQVGRALRIKHICKCRSQWSAPYAYIRLSKCKSYTAMAIIARLIPSILYILLVSRMCYH